jgi:hypothetical protein
LFSLSLATSSPWNLSLTVSSLEVESISWHRRVFGSVGELWPVKQTKHKKDPSWLPTWLSERMWHDLEPRPGSSVRILSLLLESQRPPLRAHLHLVTPFWLWLVCVVFYNCTDRPPEPG